MRSALVMSMTCATVLTAAACSVEPPAEPGPVVVQHRVGGESALAGMFTRVGADYGVPADVLAATSYVRTRLRIVDVRDGEHGGEAIGLFGLRDADVLRGAALAGVTDDLARRDPEASTRAFAVLLKAEADPLDALEAIGGERFAHEVSVALARGIDARDADGARVVVAARPEAYRGLSVRRADTDYAGAVWTPASTANYTVANREVGDIDHIVIHNTEGNFSGAVSWFQNPQAKVSSHYMLRSSDGYVVQMVREKNVAWHDRCFNTTTIGIEHEGFSAMPDQWFTEVMYVESAKLAAALADRYSIPKVRGRIVGHGDAPDCSDHTDPGPGWKWDHYIELVNTGGAPMFAASEVTVDAPTVLESGEVATVTVTLTNIGNTMWELDATRLGTALPQDRESELFVDGDWIAPNRTSGIDANVAPGGVGTFTFEIKAPEVTKPTVYDEAFQPIEEGVTWFGPEIHVVVEVVPPADEPGAGGCSTGGSSSGLVVLGLAGLFVRRRRRS